MSTSLDWSATQTVPPLALSLGLDMPSPTKLASSGGSTSSAGRGLYGESSGRSLEFLRRSTRSTTVPPSPAASPPSSGASTPQRPSLIRKKSGELVKSSLKLPSLVRTKSLPNTKNVHFPSQDSLVDVRRFNGRERPASVSLSESDTSDDEDDYDQPEWQMTTPNFTSTRYDGTRPDVYLEQIALHGDVVQGSILVRNLGFQKHVVVRYTTNFWASASEIEAKFTSDIKLRDSRAGFDRFVFDLPLRALPLCRNSYNATAVFFAIRYSVNHQELWDNNKGLNYELSFKTENGYEEEEHQLHQNQNQNQNQGQRPRLNRVPSFMTEEPAGTPKLRTDNQNALKSRYSFGSALSTPRFDEQKSSISMGSDYQDILERYCFYTPKGAQRAQSPPKAAQQEQPKAPAFDLPKKSLEI